MDQQAQNKFNWRSLLGTLAISLGALGIVESPAQATPERIQSSFELAQVGVRSRIDGPTPLNLRPRTHIPLPESRYNSRDDYGYSGSRKRKSGYDRDYHHTRRRGDRHGRDTVIIIRPSNDVESYRSNDDSYIRVIRK